MQAKLHLSPMQDEHVVVVEVVGVAIRFILAQGLKLWWHRFPSVDLESRLGCPLEDQCLPLQA